MTYRSRKLLDVAEHAPCQRCGAEDGTVVAAHSNQLRDGKGRGLKASDYRIAFLCAECHYAIDEGTLLNRAEKQAEWERAHRKTIGWLFENGHLEVKK